MILKSKLESNSSCLYFHEWRFSSLFVFHLPCWGKEPWSFLQAHTIYVILQGWRCGSNMGGKISITYIRSDSLSFISSAFLNSSHILWIYSEFGPSQDHIHFTKLKLSWAPTKNNKWFSELGEDGPLYFYVGCEDSEDISHYFG